MASKVKRLKIEQFISINRQLFGYRSLLKLLNQINTEGFNDEQQARMVGRKEALGKMSNFTKKMAMSAIPLGAIAAFASTPAKAEAKSAQQDLKILNYALLLEYLERDFYNQGVASGVIPSKDQPIFKQIQKHEQEHVKFLTEAINKAGGTPISKKPSDFDYTAGGLVTPFKKYAQFQAVSQAFEDTGVRAYKGQAPRIMRKSILQAALQIHSVEARHAAEVRRLRHKSNMKTLPCITGAGKYAELPKAFQPIYEAGKDKKKYPSEGNVTQAGINVSDKSKGFISKAAGSQAFDEPLGMTTVSAIVKPFLK